MQVVPVDFFIALRGLGGGAGKPEFPRQCGVFASVAVCAWLVVQRPHQQRGGNGDQADLQGHANGLEECWQCAENESGVKGHGFGLDTRFTEYDIGKSERCARRDQ